jgi:3-hydroxybutyryl-CoA dehydrogenase
MSVRLISTVGVIGTGTMGQGIAQVCATAGYNVILFDTSTAAIEKGIASIKNNIDVLVSKGKLLNSEAPAIIGRISSASAMTDVKADLIIEAVVENLEVKRKLFQTLEDINQASCILTSNTSSIPITQIIKGLKNSSRFAGLHFFNPAAIMKLVEIIRGTSTSDETISLLKDFVIKLGKQPVIAQDSPGFIVNRVARHYYVEGLRLLEEGVSSVEGIDKLLRSSGFKMGPFELMDLIGVDVNFSVTSSMYNAFHQDSKFRPSRIQQQKVDAGHHGRKTGKGFYDYETKPKN